MSEKSSNSEYGRIARLAYENGVDLHDEARLLLKNKSPRAFALAVASAEELMKAFLCDIVWKRDLDPDTLVAEPDNGRPFLILTRHKSKQHLFALFLHLSEARKRGRKAMEETAERLERTMITNSLTLKGNAEIDELIIAMESLRKDSLYVGVKSEGGEIKTPKTKISTQMSEDVLLKVEQFIPLLETHLKLSRSDYQKVLSKIRDEKSASTESSQSPNQQLP